MGNGQNGYTTAIASIKKDNLKIVPQTAKASKITNIYPSCTVKKNEIITPKVGNKSNLNYDNINT